MDVFSQQAGEFSPDGNIQVLGSSREIFLMFNDQLLKTETSLGSREENKQGKNGTRSLLPKPRGLITPCYFLTKPPGCWRASSLAEVLRFPLGICCSGRGINGPQGGPSAPSKGQDEGTQFPNSLHIPQKQRRAPSNRPQALGIGGIRDGCRSGETGACPGFPSAPGGCFSKEIHGRQPFRGF